MSALLQTQPADSPAAAAKWKGLQWHGATCAILASGESLTQDLADQVRAWRFGGDQFSRRAIVINTSWQRARWADVLFASDLDWWKHHYAAVRDPDNGFQGSLWTQDQRALKFEGLHFIKSLLSPGLNKTPGVVNQGGNGGYMACGLAYQAGVRKILLFGFDMKGSHWHGKHPRPMTDPPKYLLQSWAQQFVRMANDLTHAGVEVLNCNPDSALKAFPKVDPREALA